MATSETSLNGDGGRGSNREQRVKFCGLDSLRLDNIGGTNTAIAVMRVDYSGAAKIKKENPPPRTVHAASLTPFHWAARYKPVVVHSFGIK